MYVIPSLRLYGFKKSVCPNNKDLFSRFGKRLSVVPTSEGSMPLTMDKLESLEYIDSLDRKAKAQEDYDRYVASLKEESKESKESKEESLEA